MERRAVVRHGRRLEYFTITWNALEGLVTVVAGGIEGLQGKACGECSE
ncbi:MAG TPA: hypothetical protein VNO32_16915 [Candidatus Acidoferrum sp.]|nr:hypothetical protein [Candidatus Acidoferrum sp.]